jgi:electron transport complex protein RnfC
MKSATFKNGIHPTEFKNYTEHKPLEKLPLPAEVFIPLQQHIGAPCQPIVEKGQSVKTGELIGTNTGFISSQIHASISGTIKTIDTLPHPLGMNSLMIQIVSDGNDEWVELPAKDREWESLTSDKIIEMIEAAGIVGLGGAAFPTHVKLMPPKGKSIDTFILNSCECEPYLTADHRMMLDQTEDVVLGTRILMKALGVKRGIIGIENNKPDAVSKMTKAVRTYANITVVPLQVKYPQGAEKMLIKAVINRTVPTGRLPLVVGVVVNNVGTAIAVAEAVTKRKPLIERVVTVTGDGIREPKNVIARIGTTFKDVLNFCGGLTDDTVKVIMGGPMMGLTQHTLQVPVIKATSGIVCLKDLPLESKEYPCIQCSKCIEACPMNLMPTRLARFSKVENWQRATELGILNCIECGSCAYVCPAKIPLVQWIKIGKLRVSELQERQKAAVAEESK